MINLYPKELNGLLETCQLVFKENQKEDFVKEFPLVADYCTKIASLPKIVSDSSFLRSFFFSNFSDSSIAIANDSNSPNRNRQKSEALKDGEIKPNPVNDLKTEKPQLNTELSSSSESSTSTLISSESQPDTTINSATIATFQPDSQVNGQSKSKNMSAVVSVANVMSEAKQRLNEQLSTNTRSNSIGRSGSISQNQPLPQPIPLFNPQFPPGQLNIHAFQPISNMLISSPPCASPNNPNSHSLNNSRSNSPWMMMPPPSMPPHPQQFVSIPSSQSNHPISVNQVFPHHHTLPMRSSSGNKIKDMKHHLSHYAINAQEEVK